jgi:hypothetical protein
MVGWLVYPCCFHFEHRASVKRFLSLQFLNLRHSVRLLGLVIMPSQCYYVIQTQNKRKHVHASSGNRTHHPSFRASEDSSYLKLIFLIGIVGGGVYWVHSALRPLIGLLCQSRVIMMMEKLWNDWQGKPKYSEKTYPSSALSTSNPTCCPGRRSGKSALRFGTV